MKSDLCQQTCALYGICTCSNSIQKNNNKENEMINYVTKRNGEKIVWNADRVNDTVLWATNNVTGVDYSTIALRSSAQLYEGISTVDIQKVLIKTAADMINERTPNYDLVAGRLEIMNLRKEAYGVFAPPSLIDHINTLVGSGHYDKELKTKWSNKELKLLDEVIDHDLDLNYRYAATQQFKGKYLVQNRKTKQIYESPQMAYMCMSMALHQDEPIKQRLQYVIDYYNATSQGKISLPTPVMAGVRTPTRQFASCTVVDCGDSLDSINSSNNAIVKYISQRAGIGINGGAIRSLGSEVRGGEVVHTGKIPFYKTFMASVKSSSQGGIRGGAATLSFTCWDYEFESLVVLKNNKGTEENRVRHLDYSIQFNKLMYTRLIKGENITLLSPNVYNGKLYEAFFSDQEEFERLYLLAEADNTIKLKKTLKAVDIFAAVANERANTGRIYIMNVDNANKYGTFNEKEAPIRLSNLCQEIDLPTSPMGEPGTDEGEIALCVLSAFNLGACELNEYEHLGKVAIRALDNLIDYQNYPIKQAEKMKLRRSLGVGVTSYAYWLTKQGLKYTDEASLNATHVLFENISFNLIKASIELAKEKGHCKLYHETKWSKGILPIDNYKEDLDKVCKPALTCDWESLRDDLSNFGIRNSTLMALMPSETSSQITNSTNGIEPPRGLITIKQSKDGIIPQAVPELEKYRNSYQLLWELPSNTAVINLTGVMQKFVCQGISTNFNYNPAKFPEGKLPIKIVMQDLLHYYKLGGKQIYYHNTNDGTADQGVEDDCSSGACSI